MKCGATESFDSHSNHVTHSISISYFPLELESCKAPDSYHNVRVIERKYSIGQKYLFKLRWCSNYGGSSNRELFKRIY